MPPSLFSRYPKNCVKLADIGTWATYRIQKAQLASPVNPSMVNEELNKKLSLFVGDITSLQVDAIVNAANNTLLGGGGVDGAIHRAAGYDLLQECRTLGGCATGRAKITKGYKLPAKHVIHTVGPIGEKHQLLEDCYTSCLNILLENNLRSIAFCCVSTGAYGFRNRPAAEIATDVVRQFLIKNSDKVDRIIFCLFLDVDVKIYEELLQQKFPRLEKNISKTLDAEKDKNEEESLESEMNIKNKREEEVHEGRGDKKLQRCDNNTEKEL